MKNNKSNTPGGNRPNSGRPKGEPTTPIMKRVPVKYRQHIIKLIDAELQRLKSLSCF